jgi:uncharacterized protein (TIGR00730 family)
MMKNICVFCGSSTGSNPEYIAQARRFADELLTRKYRLVYGGARIGLMGEIADTVLDGGGEAVGVMPRGLVDREVAHGGLTELRIVETMHERKAVMADLADGYVALPGGCGTIDELFETLTWAQLQIHEKPTGLLNIQNYYSGLLAYVDHAVEEGFIRDCHRKMLLVDTNPSSLFDLMEAYRPVRTDKLTKG